MGFKQAERLPTDGQISVTALDDNHLAVCATTDGKTESVRVSKYNAARIFGCLALFLGIELPKSISKEVRF